MSCFDETIRTTSVAKGDTVHASLPASGALRFERAEGAMTGDARIEVQDGAITMHYADGTEISLTA